MIHILGYITWNVSPFIYEGEHFAIGWYGTLWTLGLLGMLVTLLITFKHDGVPSQFALITFMVSLVCVIFFGHLFQGLFYEWRYFPDNPIHFLETDWYYRNYYFEHPWKFFDFAHGGFASHGCFIGGIIASILMGRWMTNSMWWYADRISLGLCVVAMAVRIGNFILGEIGGVETTVPWGVRFVGRDFIQHPTQIYEALSFFMAMSIAWLLYSKYDAGKYKGLISGVIMSIALLLRVLIEMVKLPQMAIEHNWMLYMGQWLSIPMVIWSIWLVFYSIEQGKSDNLPPKIRLSRAELRRENKKR